MPDILSMGYFDNPWFFPTTEEYRDILEAQGFYVKYIELIKRPTPIDDIANWLVVFTNGIIEDLMLDQKKQFMFEVREIPKKKIYSEEEGWVADYIWLRVEAVKI